MKNQSKKQQSLPDLVETQQEMAVFFNAMDEVFFSVDMVNGRVINVSPACEKLYGYKRSDFLSNHLFWFTLIHPDDRHILEKEDEVLQRGEQINNQYRIVRKDKAIRWIENKIIPTLDENGKLMRVDGVTRDITENKAAEEKLKKSFAIILLVIAGKMLLFDKT